MNIRVRLRLLKWRLQRLWLLSLRKSTVRHILSSAMAWCWNDTGQGAAVPTIAAAVCLLVGRWLGCPGLFILLAALGAWMWTRRCERMLRATLQSSSVLSKWQRGWQVTRCFGPCALGMGAVLLTGSLFSDARAVDRLFRGLGPIIVGIGQITAVLGFLWLCCVRSKAPTFIHHRGPTMASGQEAREWAAANRSHSDRGLDWAGMKLPSAFLNCHFLVVGITGSGKTTIVKGLAQSILRRRIQYPGERMRAVIFDAKQDLVSHLSGLPLVKPFRILNPFDLRSVAWNLAVDARDHATIDELVRILIPDLNESQPFFPDSARAILGGVMKSFAETRPNLWTFRDVLLAVRSVDSLRTILSRSRYTAGLIGQYFKPPSTFANVVSTLASKLVRFEPIAAAWEHCTEKISLNEWIDDESILILGNDDARSGLREINRVIMKRIAELLLARPDRKHDRTWLLLDEARELGKIDLHSLLVRGRSKDCTVVLGIQDIDGYRDVMGEKLAQEIVGQCAVKTFLRLGSQSTAEWASKTFGEVERWEYYTSTSRGKGGGSFTTSEHLVKRELVLPSQFLELPMGNWDKGFSAFNVAPWIGAYRSRIDADYLKSELLPPNQTVRDYIERPAWQLRLEPWNENDLARLGLPLELAGADPRSRAKHKPLLRT